MNEEPKQWIVMHCLNAFKDAHGKAGEHKIPLEGYDTPMTKTEALKALNDVEKTRPNEDFSIRRLSDVLPFNK